MTQSPAASSNAKPLHIDDITVVDNSKLGAVTAAALGNAMEWFDFGVYGFVAATLGKVFFPDASPAVQTIAALGTFSVPFLVRPLGGVFFGLMGDKFGRQKVLSITIIIMAISTFLIGLIPSYLSIGLWAPILLLLCKLAQGFSVGGEYTGAAVFVAEYAPDRQRGFLGSWLDFGSIAGFVLGAGLVVLLQTSLTEASFQEWGWRIPFLIAGPLGVLGLYLRHAAEETPAFIEQLEKMEQEDRAALTSAPHRFLSRNLFQVPQSSADLYWHGAGHQHHLLHVADLYAHLSVQQPGLRRRARCFHYCGGDDRDAVCAARSGFCQRQDRS